MFIPISPLSRCANPEHDLITACTFQCAEKEGDKFTYIGHSSILNECQHCAYQCQYLKFLWILLNKEYYFYEITSIALIIEMAIPYLTGRNGMFLM